MFRIADRADAHVAGGQRDQPRPAVVVAIDADVAGVAAGAAFDAAVVAEHRRRLVARVLALELELAAEEGVAAAGVDHVARAEGQRIAVGAPRMHQRRAAVGADPRSEETRVGKAGVGPCRSWWSRAT